MSAVRDPPPPGAPPQQHGWLATPHTVTSGKPPSLHICTLGGSLQLAKAVHLVLRADRGEDIAEQLQQLRRGLLAAPVGPTVRGGSMQTGTNPSSDVAAVAPCALRTDLNVKSVSE